MTLSEHAERNREAWTGYAPEYAANAERAWGQEDVTWGVWQIPDAEVHALPDVRGKDVVELGCGTAYISAWLARKGARVTGVDVTPAPLETARAMQAKFDLEFRLVEASAEDVPLPDASFDLAVSEYGASIWADPYLWIPDASRLLRPGGELVFLVNGTILVLCFQEQEIRPDERLRRPYFGIHRFEWPDDPGVDFPLGYGDWIRLLRANGFAVEDLIELQAPEGAPPHRYEALAGPEWARKWPSEEIWRARKTG
jgi:ubiquinone/menaquinone biosynthesis C-methylase UbiE